MSDRLVEVLNTTTGINFKLGIVLIFLRNSIPLSLGILRSSKIKFGRVLAVVRMANASCPSSAWIIMISKCRSVSVWLNLACSSKSSSISKICNLFFYKCRGFSIQKIKKAVEGWLPIVELQESVEELILVECENLLWTS